MAKTLLEWETLDADQISDIMAGNPPRAPKPTTPPQKPSTDSSPGPEPSAPAPA